jgi:hypothetical protein
MNFRIPNKAVASGLMASAIMATYREEAVSLPSESSVDASEIQVFEEPQVFADPEMDTANERVGGLMVAIAQDPEWDEDSQRRFEELAAMDAFEEDMTVAQRMELANLEALRAMTHPSRTYDEMIADQELHRKVNDVIKSLETFIEHATRSFPAEAKANRA